MHLQELGIATLTSCFVNANRDSKSDPAKPKDFYYFHSEKSEGDRITISALACDTFFSLIKSGKLPGWVVPVLPIDKLEVGRKRGEVGKPRAWVGEGVILIAPVVQGDQVVAAIAVTEAVIEGTVIVTDVDSDTRFAIVIPPNTEHCWMLDAEFALDGEF